MLSPSDKFKKIPETRDPIQAYVPEKTSILKEENHDLNGRQFPEVLAIFKNVIVNVE
jgi:hypothetical protein